MKLAEARARFAVYSPRALFVARGYLDRNFRPVRPEHDARVRALLAEGLDPIPAAVRVIAEHNARLDRLLARTYQ